MVKVNVCWCVTWLWNNLAICSIQSAHSYKDKDTFLYQLRLTHCKTLFTFDQCLVSIFKQNSGMYTKVKFHDFNYFRNYIASIEISLYIYFFLLKSFLLEQHRRHLINPADCWECLVPMLCQQVPPTEHKFSIYQSVFADTGCCNVPTGTGSQLLVLQ